MADHGAFFYMGYFGLLKLGATRKESLIFGSTMGFVLQFPIEIMDGLHEGYGYSWVDIASNTIGSTLVFGQELLFRESTTQPFILHLSPFFNNSAIQHPAISNSSINPAPSSG